MARIKGVAPFMAVASMLAPSPNRYSTRSFMPQWHAKCKGVHLKLSVAWMFALENTIKQTWWNIRHCGLVESACTWDGTGCEFNSWQCRIYIISHVHIAYDYLGPFRVLWVHMAWHETCVKKSILNCHNFHTDFIVKNYKVIGHREWNDFSDMS